MPYAVAQATFVVDDTGDEADAVIDGVCATNGGVCTLRAALEEANATAAADEIQFDIAGGGVHTIQPTSVFPTISQPVLIDGYTQPGASPNTAAVGNNATLLIELDGSLAGGAYGLFITASNSTVRGLVINNFGGSGVALFSSSGNVVEGNFIGTNAGGTAAAGNSNAGVSLTIGASSNTIGGATPGARNVISGNLGPGVSLDGVDGPSAFGNVIEGNYIGTNAAGTAALGNGIAGVFFDEGTNNNTVGGTSAAARNVISGNSIGVAFGFGNDENVVQGNYIGVGADGSSSLGNLSYGVVIEGGATNITVGGTVAGAGNVIGFNGNGGVVVTGANTTGNAIVGNSLFSNDGLGIDLGDDGVSANDPLDGDGGPNNLQNTPEVASALIDGAGDLLVNYNVDSDPANAIYDLAIEFFGADADDEEGEVFLSSDVYTTDDFPGVRQVNLGSASALGVSLGDVLVATATDGDSNTSEFSGGVAVASCLTVTTTNDTGPGSLRDAITCANATPGLDAIDFAIPGAGPHVIAPLTALPTLVDPVVLDGETQAGATCGASPASRVLTVVLDGINAGAGSDGLRLVSGSDGSVVRGLVIQRWPDNGVVVNGGGAHAIECNFIGTDVTGTVRQGNASAGVLLEEEAAGKTGALSVGTTVGGTTADAGNLISGNGGDGVLLEGGATTLNRIEGNFIGTDAAGTSDLGNNGAGVAITSDATNNTVGGTVAGAGNVIGFNGGGGVVVTGASTTGNAVVGNSLFLNTGLGIDLGDDGVTANDPLDGDAGPNNLQNTPELVSALIDGAGDLLLNYSVDTDPANATYDLAVEFFFADSDGEEGDVLLSSDIYTTADFPGIKQVNLGSASALGVGVGEVLVATAIDDDGNTSEFSAPVVVEALSVGTIVVTTVLDNTTAGDGACTLREAMLNANTNTDTTAGDCAAGGGTPDAIEFAIPGAGPHVIAPVTGLPTLVDPVVLDGETQAGSTCGASLASRVLTVVLDGINAGAGSDGLRLVSGSDGSVIRGLVIQRWPGSGVVVSGGGSQAIECNIIGTDETGTLAQGNSAEGVLLEAAATGATVGGTVGDAGNLISGNGGTGIRLANSGSNLIEGNVIGTDAAGTSDLGNGSHGVVIEGGAANNTVGGTVAGAGNVIGFNGGSGVVVTGSNTIGNVIDGNFIGTDEMGALALGNTDAGVLVEAGAANNTVGGSVAGAGNVIGFNGGGVVVTGSNTTGNAVVGNSLFSNTGLGIDLGDDGVTSNDPLDGDAGPNNLQNTPELVSAFIDGAGDLLLNYSVDTDPANATYDLAIEFFGADTDDEEGEVFLSTDIYTTADFPGIKQVNLGSASALGVSVGEVLVATATDDNGNTSEFSSPVLIEALSVGTIVVTTAVDNTTAGDGECTLREAMLNANADMDSTAGDCAAGGGTPDVIGFAIPGAGPHVIAPTTGLPPLIDAVVLDGETQAGSTCGASLASRVLTVVLDGINAGAGADGLRLGLGSDGSVVRGLVIRRWPGSGVVVSGSASQVIECNFIGTDETGTLAQGNSAEGVLLESAALKAGASSVSTTVGGTTADAGNLISGNSGAGVSIVGVGATLNRIEGNFIGTNVAGTSELGNGGAGVAIGSGATDNTVGGTVAGVGNVIGFNGGGGVVVTGSNTTGNAVVGNSLFSNTGLGIDLGDDGVTPNDPFDGDAGPNNLQNSVVLTTATSEGSTTTVLGTLISEPNTLFRVDLFSNPEADASGFGEGVVFHGFTDVTTNAIGNASLNFTISTNLEGSFITATATDPNGNTSEFSEALLVSSLDLALTKDDGGVTASPGSVIVYTLTYDNVGGVEATGVILEETLPAFTSFDIAASDPGWVDQGDGTYTLALGTVEAGASGTALFGVQVDAPAPVGLEEVENVARLFDDGTHGDDVQPINNSAAVTTPIEAAPRIRATKTAALLVDADGDNRADPGDTISYIIFVENRGDQESGAVRFDDVPDPNTTVVMGSVNTSHGTVLQGNTPGDAAVEVDVGPIAVGDVVRIVFEVTVNDPLPAGVEVIANQGLVSDANFSPVLTDDPATPLSGDPTLIPADPVESTPVVAATKTDALFTDGNGNSQVDPGDTIGYTVMLNNTGGSAATGVVFTDTPGAFTALESGTVATSQGTVTLGNGPSDTAVEVDVGTLAPNTTVTITFQATVDASLPGSVSQVANQGLVEGDGGISQPTDDPDTPPAGDATGTPMGFSADLRLEKSADTETPDVGGTVVYTLTVTNLGTVAVASVEVTDVLPEGVTFVSATPPDAYEDGIWSAGTLLPGADTTLAITVRVDTAAPVTNTATITNASVPDPDASNNTSSVTVDPRSLAVEVDPAALDVGPVPTDRFADGAVTVSNVGDETLEITAIGLRQGNAGWRLVGGGEPGSLPAGAAREIALRFEPSSRGAALDTLEIVTSAQTLAVPLEGVGLLVAYTVAPEALDFDTLPVGTTRTDAVQIANTGDVPLDLAAITLGEPGQTGDFSIAQGGEDRSIAPGDSTTILVAFTPATRGSQEALLAFTLRDDALGVPLAGTGIVVAIALDPQELDFGERLVGDAAEDMVQVSNTGDVALEITDVSVAGGAESAFSLVSGGEPGSLPAGAARDVLVRFAPSEPGTYLDSLRIALSAGGDLFVRLRGVGLALGFTVTLEPDTAMVGTPLTVAIQTTDLFNPTTRDLFYRRGGEQAYQQVTMDLAGGAPLRIQSAEAGIYTGVIPGDFVTERGVDYYVRLSDGLRAITFPEQTPAERPAHERVWVEQRTSAATLVPEAYRMISVPIALTDPAIPGVLVDDFGAYAPDRWRLIRWQQDLEAYQEYTLGLEGGFTPGTAFWLITALGGTYDIEAGWSVDASGPFSLTLPPGWSQVGHPFAFPVAWSAVEADGLVDPPVAYDGDYQYDQSLLQPWEGYFVYNSEPVPVTLSVPARAATGASAKHAGSPAAAGRYTVRLVAELPGAGLKDAQNVLGLADEANEGRDALDRAEAPPLSPYVRLSILDGGDRFAVNMKPTHGEGHRWDLEVTAQTLPEDRVRRREVTVRLAEQGQRPEGAAVYVFDLDLGTPVPLAANAFTVTLTDDEPVRRLRLIVGTPAFAEQHSDDIPLTPVADRLAQNYPNPFNQETRIAYKMSQRGRVLLEIYDALGRRVRTLVDVEQAAGEHVVVWDGRDETGRTMANGLYFYRLQAGPFSATQAMTLLRD